MRSSSLGMKLPTFFAQSQSASTQQTITTPVLNPLSLSYEDSLLLGGILQQIYLHTDHRYLPMGESTIEFLVGDKLVSINLSLLHPILLQPCNHVTNGYHVEVFGKVLGSGAFGCVSLSAGRLACQPDGSLLLNLSKHVIKDLVLDNSDLSSSSEELDLEVESGLESLEIVVNEELACLGNKTTVENAKAEATMGKIILGSKKAIITNVYDEKHAFIIQEYYEGEELTKVLANPSQLNVDQRCNLLLAILFAVKRIHTLGIIHRDIKPANILVSLLENNKVVVHIVDVNLAKSVHDKSAVTCAGTPLYMSAEAFLKGVVPDITTDAYSVGLVAAQVFGAEIGLLSEQDDAIRDIEYSFKGLFSGCEELSKEHEDLLAQCIYGLKVGDHGGRFSEDKAIAILDQIIMERKVEALKSDAAAEIIQSAHEYGKGLRDSTWNMLQDGLPLLLEVCQRDHWVTLLLDDADVRDEGAKEISEKIAIYINNLNMLKLIYQQALSHVSEEPQAIATFISVLPTRLLTKIESKAELGKAIDYIFEDYIASLTAFNDTCLRIHALIEMAVAEDREEQETLQIGMQLSKCLERLSDGLAKVEGCSFTLDDMVKMTHKLHQRIKKVSKSLDELESQALAGKRPAASFLPSLLTTVAAFFSPFAAAIPSSTESLKELPKREYGQRS